MESLITQAMF